LSKYRCRVKLDNRLFIENFLQSFGIMVIVIQPGDEKGLLVPLRA
jgi:hypothetical protein